MTSRRILIGANRVAFPNTSWSFEDMLKFASGKIVYFSSDSAPYFVADLIDASVLCKEYKLDPYIVFPKDQNVPLLSLIRSRNKK